MLSKLKKIQADRQSEKGFTIIEVMIVLAIAGLIILIVFLAVPALQRNSRNTQRKSDIGRIGSAAATVISNSNGSVAALTTATLNAEVGTLGYYAAASVIVNGSAAGALTNPAKVDQVNIQTGATCSGADAVAGSARSIAILYDLEPGTPVCITQ